MKVTRCSPGCCAMLGFICVTLNTTGITSISTRLPQEEFEKVCSTIQESKHNMDRVNGFVQVWHTSSCSTDDSNGVIESHFSTSSDVTFTLDFPIPRESYVNMPVTPHNSSIRKRDANKGHVFDSSFLPVHTYNEYSHNSAGTQLKLPDTGFKAWTSAKISKACEEFSEVSTFHGMRFMCAKKFHRFRKCIWVFLVLCCLVAVAVQVYKQVRYFYSNPKSVSVEKKHTDFVQFPSLTICNENSFKITAAMENGLYNIVNKMMAGSLTMGILEEAGKADLKLDELNLLLGNHMETMLLRCKWGEHECGSDNFTTVMTDHGLCFTFNGPGSGTDLRVHAPGLSKGLQLTLNVEEYERMAGAHVASGIHMLVHMKREFPLVEQFGQAVAAGSHTFVALKLKKEHRLGPPYDPCKTGHLTYVSNVTYDYDLPACQTDCFVKYVTDRCSCKDYHMPGDVDVCTFSKYLDCLRPAQKDYPIKAEEDCKCDIPCNSEFAETTYSYAALSKSAIDKIDKEDMDKILPRYRNALDVYEYVSEQTQYKKDRYREFSESVSAVRSVHDDVTTMLNDVKAKIQRLQTFMINLYLVKDAYIKAQTFVVKRNFMEAKNEMDETTLGELADDMYIFSHNIEKKIMDLATTSDKTLRELRYKLLQEQLLGRIFLANLALDNLTQLVYAYENGTPIFNYSLPTDRATNITFDLQDIIPRELLKKAMTNSQDNLQIGLSAHVQIVQVSRSLNTILNISQVVYDSETITQEQRSQVHESINDFKVTCIHYLTVREHLYNDVISWPLTQLEAAAAQFIHAGLKCENYFEDMLNKIDRLLEMTSGTVLSIFIQADKLLQNYIDQRNVTKFEIADLFLNNISLHARTNLQTTRQYIENYAEEVRGLWSNLDTCVFEMVQEILQEEPTKKVFKTMPDLMLLGDIETLRLRTNITDQIRLKFSIIEYLPKKYHELEILTDTVSEDLKTFSASAVIDTNFYSKNFIFLDVFFTDISYTVTEHQVAYDVFKLLSDIGGSMGLLVGASAISLFEFIDLFCVILAHVFRGSRRMGERFRNDSSVPGICCQR